MPQTGFTTCKRCKQEKDADLFNPKRARGAWCEPCYLQYFKDYNKQRVDLRDGVARYQKAIRSHRLDNKRALVAHLGGACSICGYNKSIAALDFDHTNDDGSSFPARGVRNKNKSHAVSNLLAGATLSRFNLAVEEAKKCALVCANCHRERTFPDLGSADGAESLDEARERLAKRAQEVQDRLRSPKVSATRSEARKNSPRAKALAQRNCIAVEGRRGEDVRLYASAKDTARDGFNPATVSRCLHGHLKSHGGFTWSVQDKNG